MLTFAPVQDQTPKQATNLARSNAATYAPDRRSIRWSQRAPDDPSVPPAAEPSTPEADAGATDTASSRLGHDFSRIPAHSPTSETLPPRLAIKSEDAYEQEATRVSDRVMRMAEPRARPTQAGDQRTDATAIVHALLLSVGSSSASQARTLAEPPTGSDLPEVELRTDADAARRADELGAIAYTVDNEIGFAAGAYRPDTPFGRALLAHELAHVVQKAQGRDVRAIPRRAVAISAARFDVTHAPSTSISTSASFIQGQWFIDLKTDPPGLQLASAVDVNCGGGTAAGYEVGLVQVETGEFSEGRYFGLTPADGSLVARKSQVRKPAGACMDARSGAFWTADASGEKSLKPPTCGTNVALPTFSDYPSDSYRGWIENGITHKRNYIRDVKMDMTFVDALAVKTPSGSIHVLKWLRWGVDWEGHFNSNASGSTPAGIAVGGGFWLYGDDNVRPTAIPTTYAAPSTTCVDIAAAATSSDYVVETDANY